MNEGHLQRSFTGAHDTYRPPAQVPLGAGITALVSGPTGGVVTYVIVNWVQVAVYAYAIARVAFDSNRLMTYAANAVALATLAPGL